MTNSDDTQQTLVLVKPDGVRRGLIGEVLRRIETKGFRIVKAKLLDVSEDIAKNHYSEHASKPFFGELITFITSGPVFACVIEGRHSVDAMRLMIGPTDPAKAPPGTIRGDYGEIITENLVHGSDSPESAAREIAIWF